MGAGGTILRYVPGAVVAMTVTPRRQRVSHALSATAVDCGPVAPGGLAVSEAHSVTNDGDLAADVYVMGTGAAGGAGDRPWALSPAPGIDAYSLSFGATDGGPWTPLTRSFQVLQRNVGAGGPKDFYLALRPPTATRGHGQRNSRVILLAVEH